MTNYLHSRRNRPSHKALMLIFVALLAACKDSNSPPNLPPGYSSPVSYSNSFGDYRAIVYTPSGYTAESPTPVVLMVHGCNTSAEQQQIANLFDPLADAEGFIVVYADHDTGSPPSAGTHPGQCWRFFDPIEWQRDSADPDGIAGLTRVVMDQWNVDAERIYIVGMSSGAFETSVLGATYPDLFAAIGIIAGGPFASTLADPVAPMLAQAEDRAQQAYEAMGPYQRVLPFIVIHGDADATVNSLNGDNAVQQWLMTNNLVVSGATSGPFPLASTDIESTVAEPDGYDYDVVSYRDPDACVIGKHVLIHGMDHYWPGGSSSPESAPFTDPKGPNGAKITWEFFKRYTKSGTQPPCTEAGL